MHVTSVAGMLKELDNEHSERYFFFFFSFRGMGWVGDLRKMEKGTNRGDFAKQSKCLFASRFLFNLS